MSSGDADETYKFMRLLKIYGGGGKKKFYKEFQKQFECENKFPDYLTVGLKQMAWFAGMVHGVVVHTNRWNSLSKNCSIRKYEKVKFKNNGCSSWLVGFMAC